jgi:hypothetical protein
VVGRRANWACFSDSFIFLPAAEFPPFVALSPSTFSLQTPRDCLHLPPEPPPSARSTDSPTYDLPNLFNPEKGTQSVGMPYTPPSKPSPPTTAAGSPNTSRRGSEVNGRPSLPRSASYLTKHRRSPSSIASVPSSENVASNQPTPPGTSEDLRSLVPSDSVRQSPPPVTDGRAIPSGAILSPPESPSNSDDEGLELRGRKLVNSTIRGPNIRALKDAVSILTVERGGSPTKLGELIIPADAIVGEGMHHSFSAGALDALASRKISHARASTVSQTGLVQGLLTGSEEDSEEERRAKPPMIRKKSGELVRPALRPSSRRRPSSMPGTPTFSNSKAVHFDAKLEHVRHFLQVDRPLAVSAGSSPLDSFESDGEYPFPASEDELPLASRRGPPYEWELITSNFPTETMVRKALPARVERIWLSNDKKTLHGSVAVANLAFQKFVACRFTLDYWKTTSEVAAEYTCEMRPRISPQGHDRFTFNIKLSDLANLKSKTLFFCVRYNVNGQEFWDNNDGANFQVDFGKKHLPQNGKRNFQGSGSKSAVDLPRSTRRANPNTNPRPKSMPVGFSSLQFMDQSRQQKLSLDKSMDDFLENNGHLRLKSKAAGNAASDNLVKNVSTPSGQAFGNRYDFATSLKEALKAKDNRRPVPGPGDSSPGSPPTACDDVPSSPRSGGVPRSNSGTDSPTTGDFSYEEVLDRFCFVRTVPAGGQRATPLTEPST